MSEAVAIGILCAACSGNGGPGPAPSRSPGVTGSAPDELSVAATVTFLGADADDHASSLATGDFNGDGAVDVLLAAAFADGPDNARDDAGEAYVFLGPFERGETRDAGVGEQDLTIFGRDEGDQTGRAVAAGDLNGDGLEDIVLGAPFGDGVNGDRADSGEVHVVFGHEALGEARKSIELAREQMFGIGSSITIYGEDPQHLVGFSLATANTDGDAYTDLLIGAFMADGPDDDRPAAGAVYLVRGSPYKPEMTYLLDGHAYSVVHGIESGHRLGEAVAAGDVNGDGRDDLVLAAPFAPSIADEDAAGQTYVIFSPPARAIDLAEGSGDAVIYGDDKGDQLGHSLALGDVDGDGRDDILLGAVSADGMGNEANLAGEAALVLSASLNPDVDVGASDEADAIIYGASVEDRLGRSVGIGDLGGDGAGEMILGAPGVAGRDGSATIAGAIYVMGHPFIHRLHGADGEAHYGQAAGHELSSSVFGRSSLLTADMDGDDVSEILVASPGMDGPGGARRDCGGATMLFVATD